MRDAPPVIYEANISNGGGPSFFVLLPMRIITSRDCSHKIATEISNGVECEYQQGRPSPPSGNRILQP
jgi:hypothetical protein